jgi:general secretion pathway protein K
LVIVLWLIVLLTIIAAGHSYNARIETQLAARHLETTKSRYVAEAATALTIARLLTPEAARTVVVDGRPITTAVDDRSVIVSVRRANGLVDLNTADQTLLEKIFVAGGAPPRLAVSLAARVVDWRDADDFKHLDGAEDSDYRLAGLAWTARNGRFSTIDELRYVLGMTPSVYRAISPYLTVYSETGGIDLDVAPDFLLRLFEEDNSAGNRRAYRESPPNAFGGNGIYHINVAVPAANGVFVSSETVVRVTANADSRFTILSWRDYSRLLTQAQEGAPT